MIRRTWQKLAVERLEDRTVPSIGYRTYDGTGNNLLHTQWGAANTQLLRVAPAAYGNSSAALTHTASRSERLKRASILNATARPRAAYTPAHTTSRLTASTDQGESSGARTRPSVTMAPQIR